MGALRRILARLAGHFRKSRRERDIAAELASHFQMHVDDNLRAGMTPQEARRQALLKFGSVEAAKEELRGTSTTLWAETTLRDVQYAARGLRRNPGFAATAILSLALGIGTSLSIFAVADGLLLRPLPFRDPGRIMMVWGRNTRQSGSEHNVISPANYFDWKKQNTCFESMAAFGDGPRVLSDGNRVEELPHRFATADLLPMLGVKPYRGRFFTAAEDTPDGPEVLVIGYRLWQSWFAGDDPRHRSHRATTLPAGHHHRRPPARILFPRPECRSLGAPGIRPRPRLSRYLGPLRHGRGTPQTRCQPAPRTDRNDGDRRPPGSRLSGIRPLLDHRPRTPARLHGPRSQNLAPGSARRGRLAARGGLR
jgi:hypothetical protein